MTERDDPGNGRPRTGPLAWMAGNHVAANLLMVMIILTGIYSVVTITKKAMPDIDLPIIDWRHYLEPFLDMHNSHQSFASRRRMLDHDADADNHVIWFTDAESMDGRFDQTPMALQVIDDWMGNIRRYPDRTVAENKPERAVDSCFDSDGELIYSGDDAWDGILDDRGEGPCTRRFRLYSTSRIVAGGPISGDVFKCALQPVDRAVAAGVYGSWQPSEEQLERLHAIFPEGVCDYQAPPQRRPSL